MRRNSARDTTRNKQKRQQAVRRILQVKNRKDNKQCAAGYYRLQIEKTSNSARDTTGYKQKREQAVRLILHLTNRKDNKQCV